MSANRSDPRREGETSVDPATGSSRSIDAARPADAGQLTAAGEPASATGAAGSAQPADAVEPAQRADAVEPAQRADAVEPAQRADAVEPTPAPEATERVAGTEAADARPGTEAAEPAPATDRPERPAGTDGAERRPATDRPEPAAGTDGAERAPNGSDGAAANDGAAPAEATDAAAPAQPTDAAEPAAGTALPAVRATDDRPEPARRRFLGWRRSPAALLVGLLIGLLGFALAVQVRSNTSTSGLPAARQEDLVRILDDLSSREERLRRQIAELEAARTRLSTTGDRSSTALEEARKRSTALGILAGTVPAQGPGIELTLTDPRRQLAAEDLLDAVEELRAAGAEAIQVGGVRIGLDSSFVAGDGGIAVDGVSLAAPYTLLAIGDPPTLATAMDIPGGVTDTARRAGGDARIQQRDQVVVRVLRTPRTPRYSQPTD